MTQQRPNPDQLLAEVQKAEARQRRGRLKVFFGMAAGVGKTYAMLDEGRARAAEGLDVLVGYAEQHIRPETEALLLGLDILPYKRVDYRGATLKEFDLDAALAKKPAVILVDELAHSNAPGMRHPKRWQDVMELLDAGISVYTTLNVQHLESVNDIVERITGVTVRETLPDSVLEQADEVELVDIAPEELLERFAEGKVYRPDQAEQASKHFFTRGNLLALRELALRTTAQRVDAQMQVYRRENAVRTTWAATERVLVCVGPSPMSARLVRSAKRLASDLKAEWVAVYVETAGAAHLSDRQRRRVDQTLRLAERLGARAVTLSGQRVGEEVIAYAQAHNVTKIVIGKPDRPRWREALFGSVVDDIIRRSGRIDIHVIRDESDEGEGTPPPPPRTRRIMDWRGYSWALFTVAVSTAIALPISRALGVAPANILMLYLLGVLWVATHHGRGAAVLASVLAVATFDFLFVPPFYTFAVSDRQYAVTFGVMLATALVISALTHRVREQGEAARQRERRTSTLYGLSRELTATQTAEDIAAATVRHVRDVLGYRTVLLVPDQQHRLAVKVDSGGSTALDAREIGAAQWALEHERVAGQGTDTLPTAAGTYVPLRAPRGTVGVLGVFPETSELSPDQRQLVETLGAQAAVAVERATLAEEARAAWEQVEAEFLRNTLLSGVSHELRTPLAAITGSASALADAGDALPVTVRKDMLDTITSESDRMDRLINNLLDMTRLESGGLVLNREWQPLQEIIGSAIHHLGNRLGHRKVTTAVASDVPLVSIDTVAMEQVLTNLIDNAVEYTPPGTPIDVIATRDGNDVIVEVADRGPGLPPGTETRVFEKFFRIRPTETRRGIGLGLAIARGIVQAHGGTITAHNRPGGGAMFRFTLPATGTPPSVDGSA